MRVTGISRATLTVDRDARVAFLAMRHWKRLEIWPTEEMGRALAALPPDAVEWPTIEGMLAGYDVWSWSEASMSECLALVLR